MPLCADVNTGLSVVYSRSHIKPVAAAIIIVVGLVSCCIICVCVCVCVVRKSSKIIHNYVTRSQRLSSSLVCVCSSVYTTVYFRANYMRVQVLWYEAIQVIIVASSFVSRAALSWVVVESRANKRASSERALAAGARKEFYAK